MWCGLKSKPGESILLPFSLGIDENGVIYQIASDVIRQQVVHAYANSAYNFITPPPGSSSWANDRGQDQIKFALSATKYLQPKSILEIGGGSFYNSRALRSELDITSYVMIDPSLPRELEAGVEVFHDFFPTPKIVNRKFDLILSFNCLEHVDDPLQFMRHLNQDSAEGGCIVMSFPDIEQSFRCGDRNSILHEHLSYFTQESAAAMFLNAGFELIEIFSKKDVMWCLLRASTPRHAIAKSSVALLAEADIAFKAAIDDTELRVRRALNEGGTLVFHGATNGLNTFLNLLGLSENPRVLVYDSDELKVGNYLPACINPVRSSADPRYLEADTVIISAVSFFDEIARFLINHRGFSSDKISSLSVAYPQ